MHIQDKELFFLLFYAVNDRPEAPPPEQGTFGSAWRAAAQEGK